MDVNRVFECDGINLLLSQKYTFAVRKQTATKVFFVLYFHIKLFQKHHSHSTLLKVTKLDHRTAETFRTMRRKRRKVEEQVFDPNRRLCYSC